MNCAAIIHRHASRWVDDETPFLLWEIGAETVVEHWVSVLFDSNGRLILWQEEADTRLAEFLGSRFPLSERSHVEIGRPELRDDDVFTFISEQGVIMLESGREPRNYVPAQEPATTWFALVKRWLSGLQEKGSAIPELERQIQPGIFAGHHCRIAKDAVFRAPCWIGSGSEIQGGCTLGPNAVVGENSLVARGARVQESYVLKDTCLGPAMTLEGVVAGAGRVMCHATGTAMEIRDRAMLRTL